MVMTLRQAAKATNRSTSTISKSIASGTLSVIGKKGNSFQIDESELFRVFAPDVSNEQTATFANAIKDTSEQVEIIELRIKLDAALHEIASLKEDKEDYKRRLDNECEERRKLTLLLTDQRDKQTPPKHFFARLLG